MTGTRESPARPTWHSALEPAPQQTEGVSAAGNGCSPRGQHKQAQRRPEEGLRSHTEAKSRTSSQENRAALRSAEVPLMIHSFDKYLLTTYYMPYIILDTRHTTLRKARSVLPGGCQSFGGDDY